MEFTGEIENISNDYLTNKLLVTFSVNERTSFLTEYEKVKKYKKLRIKVSKFSEKRSLDANRYTWKLISEIARVISSSNDEVYEKMLKLYGTNATDDDGNLITISVPSKVNISNADIHCAFIGKGYVGEKEFNHYRLIKGSSMYDTAEMARLIDGIVSECKALEIETLTPIELDRMKREWNNQKTT